MNELFTLLIILAAIISFINKIMSDKKRQPSTSRPMSPEPEPTEWGFPWSENELESAPAIEEEEKQSATAKNIFAYPTVPFKSEKADKPTGPDSSERAPGQIMPEQNLIFFQAVPKKIEVVGINLSSQEGLKQGIILAEILGPCKAKRNVHKF